MTVTGHFVPWSDRFKSDFSSLIRRFNCAPDLKRLWLQKVKMTSQKLMGVGKSSLIENISLAPNLKRLWLDNVKMTLQNVMGAGISSIIKHMSCTPNLKKFSVE